MGNDLEGLLSQLNMFREAFFKEILKEEDMPGYVSG
jgi:hypothetical protein